MNTVVPTGPFERLLQSDAKGFFFLKFALADFTNEQKLVSIVNRAHSLYDHVIAERELDNFSPLFTFRRGEGEQILLVIAREASSLNEPIEIGHVALTPILDPVYKQPILDLVSTLPIPHQKLQNLSLAELKKHLEIYYELVDVCTATWVARMVKTFEELEQACSGTQYQYDLSSDEHKLGLSVRKNGKRTMMLLTALHVS